MHRHSPTRALIEARPEYEFSYSDIDDQVEKFMRVQASTVKMYRKIMYDNLVQVGQNLLDSDWWDDYGSEVAEAIGYNVFDTFWNIHKYDLEFKRKLDRNDYKEELTQYFTNVLLSQLNTPRRL